MDRTGRAWAPGQLFPFTFCSSDDAASGQDGHQGPWSLTVMLWLQAVSIHGFLRVHCTDDNNDNDDNDRCQLEMESNKKKKKPRWLPLCWELSEDSSWCGNEKWHEIWRRKHVEVWSDMRGNSRWKIRLLHPLVWLFPNALWGINKKKKKKGYVSQMIKKERGRF